MSHLGRPPEQKLRGLNAPQVSSVVQVPGKTKAEYDEIKALRTRLKQKNEDTFLGGKPVFLPPVRGAYGEAKIRTEADPRV